MSVFWYKNTKWEGSNPPKASLCCFKTLDGQSPVDLVVSNQYFESFHSIIHKGNFFFFLQWLLLSKNLQITKESILPFIFTLFKYSIDISNINTILNDLKVYPQSVCSVTKHDDQYFNTPQNSLIKRKL